MLYRFTRITYHQTDRVAEICGNLGVVCVASIVLPSILNNFYILPTLLGTALTGIFIGLSVYLSK